MPDYTEFDAKLLALIAAGVNGFTSLAGKLETESQSFCTTPRSAPSRVVDRRLQALQKQKKLIYSPKTGWSIAKV